MGGKVQKDGQKCPKCQNRSRNGDIIIISLDNNLTWLDREKSVKFAEIDANRSESVDNGRKSAKKW